MKIKNSHSDKYKKGIILELSNVKLITQMLIKDIESNDGILHKKESIDYLIERLNLVKTALKQIDKKGAEING